MQPLAQVQDPDLLTQGLFPSLAPNQLAMWRDGENVRFLEGRAEKSKGYTVEATTVIPLHAYNIVAMAQTYADSTRRIYYATTDGYNSLNLYDDGVYRSLGSGYSSGLWSLETFGTWLLATNNVDPPKIWKNGVGDAVALAGVNFSHCKILRKNNNHILAFNTDEGGDRISWASRSDPELWVADLDTNTAGGINVRDLDGDISCAESLGDDLAFYSEDMMGLVHWTGGDSIFDIRIKQNGIGAVGQSAVATKGTFNYGLGRKGFWRTDGFQFEYIHSPAVKRWLDDNINWQQAYRTVALHNERLNTIEWHFQCSDAEIRGLAFNYDKPSWTKLKFPVTAALEQQVFSAPTVATGVGFGFYGETNSVDTEAMYAWLRSAIYNASSNDRYKVWEMLRLNLRSQDLIQIRFGFGDEPTDAAITWDDWQLIDRENWIANGGREAPYMQFEIQSNTVDALWEISGVDILGEPGGYI